jgi:hypothetical protein
MVFPPITAASAHVSFSHATDATVTVRLAGEWRLHLSGAYTGYPQVQKDLQMIAGTPDHVIPRLKMILEVLRPGILSFRLLCGEARREMG